MTDRLQDAVGDAMSAVATFVPKLIAFLLILIIGLLIAKAIGKAVDKVLERVGFDRAVERGGVRRALERSSYDASGIVGKLVYYALVLFVLQMAFGVFGPNPISDLLSGVIAFLPRAIVAIIIIVVAAAIAAAVRDIIGNALSGLSYGRTLANIASFFIIGLGVIAALNQVGIATTVTTPVLIAVLATVVGILVVGVGGGLVRPMQSRWERYLDTMETEGDRIRAQARRSPSHSDQTRPVGSGSTAYSGDATSQSALEDPTVSPQGGTRGYETGSTSETGSTTPGYGRDTGSGTEYGRH